jgi:hypothetical protein
MREWLGTTLVEDVFREVGDTGDALVSLAVAPLGLD